MGFYDYFQGFKGINFNNFFNDCTSNDILNIINKDNLNEYEFLALLSPRAENYLEDMAQRAHQLSLQHFGKTVQLFTPMYVANYCVNRCAYCSFNGSNKISRKVMTMAEVEKEARAIAATGLKHILFLTGESRQQSSVSYICDVARVLRQYFASVSIEIYPLTADEYKEVVTAGVDGFCMYQETYNEDVYDQVHLGGPKKNYRFRLDAPERACKAGMRSVSLGALLGLYEWRKEAFATGLHAYYLQEKYPEMELALGVPRIRPHVGVFENVYEVTDQNIVQVILAYRMFLPQVCITVTTRERPEFRNNLIPLGINKMSAGVSTEVGGHTCAQTSDSQFEIADPRSVAEMYQMISAQGYQPVLKNWMSF